MSWVDVSEEVRWRVAALLDRFERGQWDTEIRVRLREGRMRELDPELNLMKLDKYQTDAVMEAAEEEWQHGQAIVRHRKDLHARIAEAQRQIGLALGQIKNLDELSDAEYENGSTDAEHFLNKAARSLRAAQSLKPTGADGE